MHRVGLGSNCLTPDHLYRSYQDEHKEGVEDFHELMIFTCPEHEVG